MLRRPIELARREQTLESSLVNRVLVIQVDLGPSNFALYASLLVIEESYGAPDFLFHSRVRSLGACNESRAIGLLDHLD